ncbi:hypothetical protein GCM10007049_00960 [Echinicola pacifica]|uniref:Uncharacterized protein n=1 Tax=Echinicola pacifica TaxID=346377 RepID=A0A918PKT1_9BACT|nr:hypothetical protein [Echinicola pacifica]GGZ13019.1 hypothetical protein GCM10007049_00960 [Echinicola pacifica]
MINRIFTSLASHVQSMGKMGISLKLPFALPYNPQPIGHNASTYYPKPIATYTSPNEPRGKRVKDLSLKLNLLAFRKDRFYSELLKMESKISLQTRIIKALNPCLKSALNRKQVLSYPISKIKMLKITAEDLRQVVDRNPLRGVEALKELCYLDLQGKIDNLNYFEKISKLPELEILSLAQGPSIPAFHQHRLPNFPQVKKITIDNAKERSDFEIIFLMPQLSTVILKNFSAENLKEIINIRCLGQFTSITIYLNTCEDHTDQPDVLVRNLIKHYSEYVKINIFYKNNPTT